MASPKRGWWSTSPRSPTVFTSAGASPMSFTRPVTKRQPTRAGNPPWAKDSRPVWIHPVNLIAEGWAGCSRPGDSQQVQFVSFLLKCCQLLQVKDERKNAHPVQGETQNSLQILLILFCQGKCSCTLLHILITAQILSSPEVKCLHYDPY